MRGAVRPYATAGVALVGASVIAVTPAAAPLPDAHLPTLRVPVALTQFVDPITALVQVIQTSVMNATALSAITAANPTPILTKIIANQTANAAAISAGFQTAATDLTNNLMGIPAQLQGVLTDLSSGDIFDAVQQLFFEIPLGLALGPLFDVATPLSTIATQTTQNLANAVSVLSNNVLMIGLGVQEPIFSVVNQIGTTGQTLFNVLSTGDLLTAASALINAPIELIGAFLKGTPSLGGQGILTPTQFGTIFELYSVAQAIAASLTRVPPAPAAAPTASPNLAAKTVTVTTAPAVNAPAPAVTTPPTVTSGPAAKLLTPATGASVTTEAPKVSSGPVNTLLPTLNATNSGNKVTPGQVGGRGTAAGDQVSSAPSKAAAGPANGSGHLPNHGK